METSGTGLHTSNLLARLRAEGEPSLRLPGLAVMLGMACCMGPERNVRALEAIRANISRNISNQIYR